MVRKGKEPMTSANADTTIRMKWNQEKIDMFIDLLIETRTNKDHVEKFAWNVLATEFEKKYGIQVSRQILKNRWDAMKKEWNAWTDLRAYETCLEWDYERDIVTASDEWWDERINENRLLKKFRYAGLYRKGDYELLFNKKSANGRAEWLPTTRVVPNEDHGGDDEALSPPNPIDLDQIPEDISTASSPVKESPTNPSIMQSASSGKRSRADTSIAGPSASRRSRSANKIIVENSIVEQTTTMKDMLQVIKDHYAFIRNDLDAKCTNAMAALINLNIQDKHFFYFAVSFLKDRSSCLAFLSLLVDDCLGYLEMEYQRSFHGGRGGGFGGFGGGGPAFGGGGPAFRGGGLGGAGFGGMT